MNCQIQCWGVSKGNSVNKKFFLDELNLQDGIMNIWYFYSPNTLYRNILCPFPVVLQAVRLRPEEYSTWFRCASEDSSLLWTRLVSADTWLTLIQSESFPELLIHMLRERAVLCWVGKQEDNKYTIVKGHFLSPGESSYRMKPKFRTKQKWENKQAYPSHLLRI